jgi:hypothetical protein
LIKNTNHYEPFHGIDGFGMVYTEKDKPSRELLQDKHAVIAMKEYIEEVCICSVIGIFKEWF